MMIEKKDVPSILMMDTRKYEKCESSLIDCLLAHMREGDARQLTSDPEFV